MKTQLAYARLALWVALPMAQTSHMEGRLKMILNPTRRRALTRRTRLTMLALASAALVLLAMLRPFALAQAAAAPANGLGQETAYLQLVGVTDATVRNGGVTDGGWWGADGRRLTLHPFGAPFRLLSAKITTQPGQNGRFFAFRLPAAMRKVPLTIEPAHEALGGLTFSPNGLSNGLSYMTVRGLGLGFYLNNSLFFYGTTFPSALPQTTVRVGVPSGLWTTALTMQHPYRPSHVHYSQANQINFSHIIFSGNKIICDVAKKTPEDQHDFRIVAVDQSERKLLLPMSGESSGVQEQITAHIPPPFVLSKIKSFQIEYRSLVWTEFKNVALQPAPPLQSGAKG